MPAHDLKFWQHAHDYATTAERGAERRTRRVVALAFLAMLGELVAGWLTGSMALLADGWHMASHVGAIGLAAYAYGFARRHAGDARYTFGTGKVSALAGYSSALFLGAVALWMAGESLERLFAPVAIRYPEAMAVAALGLVVNLVSAWMLEHDHDHDHDHGHGHVDHNLRAAYLHVLADALTSILAIAALAGGWLWGWRWLDPLMGVVGAVLIGRWAVGLARDCSSVLLDAEDHGPIEAEIRRAVAAEPDLEVADLHLWRVGPAGRACIVALVTHNPLPVEHYRARLSGIAGIAHLTVEVHQCRAAECVDASA